MPQSPSVSFDWSQSNNTCHGPVLRDHCHTAGGDCVTVREGFFTISIVWVVIGAVSFIWAFRTFRHFQTLNNDQWRVTGKEKKKDQMNDFKYFYCI